MKTLTVRGIEPDLAESLKKQAKQEGKSLNQIVIDTLKKHHGLTKKKKYSHTFHDLDDLFGRWSQKDFNRIQGKIDSEREIDPELWQ